MIQIVDLNLTSHVYVHANLTQHNVQTHVIFGTEERQKVRVTWNGTTGWATIRTAEGKPQFQVLEGRLPEQAIDVFYLLHFNLRKICGEWSSPNLPVEDHQPC